jgi:hypothetical protein
MRITIALLLALSLTACTTVQKWVPSFWDDNQSRIIVDAGLLTEQIDCSQPQLAQILKVDQELRRFQLYSEAKGTLQKDVLRVVEPMKQTTAEWVKRGEGSKTYCEIKKKLLLTQTERAAKVILGRW